MSARIRALVVDDEDAILRFLKPALEANNYEVLTAHNGEDGLKAAEEESPNVILLDVMMPGMDGFHVLRRLRRSDETRRIPVVMLTAKGESKSIFRSQELGARDHLIKPCESKELLATVGKYA